MNYQKAKINKGEDNMQSASEIERKLKDENPNVKLNEKIMDILVKGLTNEEEVLYAMSGLTAYKTNSYGPEERVKKSAIFITNKKLFFIIKNIMTYNSINISLENIKGISLNKNLRGWAIIMSYNATTISVLSTKKPEIDKFISTINNQINKNKDSIEERNDTTGESVLEQIEKLSELLKQGIITEEEFTVKKKELLEKL